MSQTARRSRAGGSEGPEPAAHGRPWLSLTAVALGVMTVGLDATAVTLANPAIAADLGADLTGLQWVTNGYLLALAVALIPSGKAADRFGRKKIFLAGVIGFFLASLMVGLSGSIGMVVFWRVVQGVAGAMLQPAGLAIIRNAFPPHRLATAIGIWGAAVGVSTAGGPIIGGLLVEHIGWEWVFYVNVPLGIAAALLGLAVIRESRDGESGTSLDPPGVLLLSGALFALVFGLIRAGSHGFDGRLPLLSFAAFAVLGAAFLARESRTAQPLLPLRLFRSRALSAATVLMIVGIFGLFGSIFFVQLYLQQVRGLGPIDAGVHILPMTGIFIVSAPLGSLLAERAGPRTPLLIGMLCNAVALYGLSRMGMDAPYAHQWPWYLLIGFAFGLVLTAATDAIVGNAPEQLAGVAGGLQQTAFQVGGMLGTSVLGAVVSMRVGDVLVDRLTEAGLAAPMARQLLAAKEYVAQGGAPAPPGTPEPAAQMIATGSHLAFMDGFHTAMLVGALVSVAGTLVALIVRKGGNSVPTGENVPAKGREGAL
jgi:EmrB/QacA subfamily drug resistance transporter